MLRLCLMILALYGLFCLNLRHSFWRNESYAQSFPVPVAPLVPAPTISITPNGTLPATAVPNSSDKTKKTVPKYYEFKSICLQPEEEKTILSDSIKQKRLSLIKEKLKKSQEAKNNKLTQEIKALLIKEYLKQDNAAEAEDLFKQDGVFLSESEQAVIAADIDIVKKLLRQAKNNLNKYLEAHPKDILALEKLAAIYSLSNNYSEAKIVYDDLSQLNPKKDYTEDLCRVSALNADHSNVTFFCEKLLKQNPKNYLAPIYLGVSLRDQEQYSDAIKSFQSSLKIEPSEFASTCLAESYALNNDLTKAIQQYEESIKIKPESKRSHLGLANAYLKKNLYPEALEQFKMSCRLGLKPISEMSTAAKALKAQKSNFADSYFDAMQVCKR